MSNPYQIRLHKFLTDFIRQSGLEFTGPEIQHNIEKLGVLVNGEMSFNRQEWLFGSPEISIEHWPERTKGNFDQVQVLLETLDLMLVFKPTGTVCQAGNGHLADNLEFFLNQRAENLDKELNLEAVLSNSTKALDNSNQSKSENSDKNKFEIEEEGLAQQNVSSQNLQSEADKTNSSFFKTQVTLENFAKGTHVNQNLDRTNSSKNFNYQADQIWLAAHRLDKDTQGLMLLARGPQILEKLQTQFRRRLVVKKYLAVVQGLVDQVYHVNNWQARDARSSVSQKFFWSQGEAKEYDNLAKNAQSIIIPQAVCLESGQSLIQVQILTGRMHQIRLQCQNLGFPLVEDPIYQTKVGLDEIWLNPKSLLKSPYWMSDLDTDESNSLEVKRKAGQLKHNFNSPKSDSTNSKQKKVSSQVMAKIANKSFSQATFHNFDNALDEFNSNLEIQQDGFYRFYGHKPVKVMEQIAFDKLKAQIFGPTDYCLLANFLALQTPEFFLESQFVDLENLMISLESKQF